MFLQVTNQTPEDLLATLRQDAVRAVRVDLAMRALVAAEHLEATPEEIDEELERTATAMGVERRRAARQPARLRTRRELSAPRSPR